MNKAVFLDRDGVIIEEKSFICSLSQSAIFPFCYEAVRLMNRNGFQVVGITNQSAVARGICTKEQVEEIHREITASLAAEGAVIRRFYYCPFHEEGIVPEYRKKSTLRKPEPGMILQAAKDMEIDLTESYMVGDDVRDIEAGRKAGCRTVLVLTGKGPATLTKLEHLGIQPDLVAENILEAIKTIASGPATRGGVG
ncbi:MAG: HAD family hydrolase [bacterium]|nr:HAD family hydrolase [bacterium]